MVINRVISSLWWISSHYSVRSIQLQPESQWLQPSFVNETSFGSPKTPQEQSLPSLPVAMPLEPPLSVAPPMSVPLVLLKQNISCTHSDSGRLYASLLTFIRSMINPQLWSSHILHFIRYLAYFHSSEWCCPFDLCATFPENLRCDQYGNLRMIRINKEKLQGHLDFTLIPNTVKNLFLRDNNLTSVGNWSDLEDKSLRSLNIRHNYHLNLNLSGLVDNGFGRERISLRELEVTFSQIKQYFIAKVTMLCFMT